MVTLILDKKLEHFKRLHFFVWKIKPGFASGTSSAI